MNVSDILGITALVVGPSSGILGTILMSRRSKQAAQTEEVTNEKRLTVEEQDSDTRAFAELVKGFMAQLKIVNDSYTREHERGDDLERKYNELEKKFTETSQLSAAYLLHIEALEKLIPTPPGIPPRPWTVK